jgi:hypothetical protein
MRERENSTMESLLGLLKRYRLGVFDALMLLMTCISFLAFLAILSAIFFSQHCHLPFLRFTPFCMMGGYGAVLSCTKGGSEDRGVQGHTSLLDMGEQKDTQIGTNGLAMHERYKI